MVFATAFLAGLLFSPAQKLDTEEIFNQALAAQQHGDLEAAINGYERVLKIAAGLIPARVNLAAAQMQLGRTEQALENYRVAFKTAPDDAQVTLLYGNALFDAARYSEAMQVIEPFEKAHPDNLDGAFLLGEALIRIKRPRDGLKLIERVAKSRKDANAYLLAALTQLQLAEYQDAKANADEAVRLESATASAWTVDGMANAGTGELKRAEAAYRKAIQLNRDDFDANLRLGTLLLRTEQDPEGAKPYLEHALIVDPESLSARFEVAKLQAALRNDQAAIANLEQILARKPDATEAHIQLYALYARAKRKEDAKREREVVDRLMSLERESAIRQRPPTNNPEDELNVFSSAAPLH